MMPEQELKVMLLKLEPDYEHKDGKVYGIYEAKIIHLIATGKDDLTKQIESMGLLIDYKIHKIRKKLEDFKD